MMPGGELILVRRQVGIGNWRTAHRSVNHAFGELPDADTHAQHGRY
jgi:hypothetical protein